MFRVLKKLFGGSVEKVAEMPRETSPAAPSTRPRVTPQPRPAQSAPSAGTLALPLNAILAQLPGDLQGRVNQSYGATVDVLVPTERILPQLARGSVKISFGELRQAAPPGTFSDEDDLDQLVVDLPLSEVLSRVNPAMLARRPPQKKVEVPEEVTGPFGAQGRGLIVSTSETRQYAAAPIAPAPARPHLEPQPAAAPVAVPTAIPPSAALRALAASPAAATSQPAAAPVSAPVVARQTECLTITLEELSNNWPETVRQEIAQLNLAGTTLALPMDVLENELKHGKVTFTWKLLRSFIKPPPTPATPSVHDGVVLELPLKIVAPLFLARQHASRQPAKVTLAEEIPDLFSTTAAQPVATVAQQFIPAKPAPPPRREEETSYYIWKDDDDTPDATTEVTKPGTAFTKPDTSFTKRFPTPNEIVRKASSLEGVAGSLIALADGLLVAKELPPDMNGENLAAFLPQIFGRISQSARELRMGELNNLSFTVGNVPWKIFRVGGMFFAAFGRPGAPLPGAELVTMVAELDRKPK